MRTRSLVRPADRSTARRVSAVAIAAAVILAPAFVATSAQAAPSPIVSVTFDDTELVYGEETQGYFNGDRELVQIDDYETCTFEYINGEPHRFNQTVPSWSSSAPLQNWGFLNSNGYYEGDVYTVAYAEPIDQDGELVCVAPALTTPGLVQASLTLAPTPPAPELPVTAAPVALTQGVAFSQEIALTYAEGFDFSEGGWIAAGPQSSAGLENGEINPLEGITFEYLNENTPGVVPTLRASGTPKYAGTITTGFQVSDLTTIGYGPLNFTVAHANGLTGPISIETAIGKPVTGATVTIVASGLQEGAAWSATVRSTPIIVGSGTIAFGGQLAQTFTIPAGLAAGAHSITVATTSADGTPYTAVLYFTVSATGTLLAVSITGLPDTGADTVAPMVLAGGLLLAGLVFTGVTVYRRRAA